MKKIFFTGFIALGLIACSDNNEIDNAGGGNGKGGTFASVKVSVKKDASTRALTNGQADNAGTALEGELATLDLLSSAGNKVFTEAASGTAQGTFWPIGGANYSTAAWETAAGGQTLALLFNKNTEITVGSATATATTEYDGPLSGLISPNFTMTSIGFGVTVQPNITEAQALAGSTAADNVFTGIDVERVVAKGLVRKHSTYDSIVTEGTTQVATIHNVAFAAVNGAKKTYLYRDNAGERTLDVNDPNQYDLFESLIHGLLPIENDAAADAAGLVRLGITGTPTEVSTAKAINAAGTANDTENANVFYFMENSGKLDVNTVPNIKTEGFYRFAYAKVYATYHPDIVMTKDGNQQTVIRGTSGKYYVSDGAGGYSEVPSTTPGAIEGYLVWKLKQGTIAKGVTFYKGAQDGVLYDSKDAAISSPVAPNQLVYTYKDGRCGYRALWNRQTEDSSNDEVVVNASARRNNAYVLDIQSFAKLGFPWDESDPEDPNLPKTDPDDPKLPDPTDPNIEPKETYMRVEATVLPWNVVDRGPIILK